MRIFRVFLGLSLILALAPLSGFERGLLFARAFAQNTVEGESELQLEPAPKVNKPPSAAPEETEIVPEIEEEPAAQTPSQQESQPNAPQETKQGETQQEGEEKRIQETPEARDDSGAKDTKDTKETKGRANVLKILRQKKCQILIETSDIKLNLLRTGTVITLHLPATSIPVRINKINRGKIQAALRKSNCNLNLEGQTATYSLGAQVQSQTPGVRKPVVENQRSLGSNDLRRELAGRRQPSGAQFMAGLLSLSAPSAKESINTLTFQLTYEWFDAPRQRARQMQEGGAYGLGLELQGFKDYLKDSFSAELFNAELVARTGYRWVPGGVGITFAPTFNFMFFRKTFEKSEFFPEFYLHRLGLELQADVAVGEDVRILAKANYMIVPFVKKGSQNFNITSYLFGLWWLL